MALSYFCPFAACGAVATYEAIKPSVCPRCQRRYADAFKVTTASAPAAPIERDDTPLRAPAPRPRVATPEPVREMTPYAVGGKAPRAKHPAARPVIPELVEATDDDEPLYDQHESRRLARELVASIDPADIVVADNDDQVVRFGTWVEEAKRAAPASAAAPKAKATKRRR